MQTPKPGAASTTPATVSKTVQRLLAQIHAEAEAEAATLAALSAKDGIVTLRPVDPATARVIVEADELTHLDAAGNRMEAYRRREEPAMWIGKPHMRGQWHPAYWYVSLKRVDASGQKWSCDLGRHVVDDFGTLVCSEGGAA